MSKHDIKINVFQKGLQRDNHLLGEAEYSTLLNGLFDAVDEGTFSLTNEMSNVLSSKFKEGFKVIHGVNDIYSNNTYFFLVNPTTGVGEFGQIKNTQTYQNLDDVERDCEGCLKPLDLAEPLENQTQAELNVYETLLTDSCHTEEDASKGFNFNINYPIKKSVIKNEKCGKTIYFTDNLNPVRYIVLDKLDQYLTTGSIICGEDQTEPTCLDAEKLILFKRYKSAKLVPATIELGGRLKTGVYEFLIAYSDNQGNELSEYMSITNPISIFDKNNVIQTQAELANPTNFSIRLNVEGLDQKFSHYKIAVIQTTLDSQFTSKYFIEGVHTINDTTVIYGGEQNKVATTLSNLLRESIFVKNAELIAEANNRLVLGGLTLEKEINLQPVVNLIGAGLKWQTHVAKEDLYENGVASSLYLGYNREEVVPFGIRFKTIGGFKTAIFPFIARPATDAETTLITGENLDKESIEANKTNCNITDREQVWQIYNTAEEEGYCIEDEEIETVEVEEVITKICYVEDIAESLNGELVLQIDGLFTGLEDYIEDNKDNCTTDPEVFQDTDLCDVLDLTNYTTDNCNEGLFEDNCTEAVLVEEELEIVSIEGEEVTLEEIDFPTDYAKLQPPKICNLYSFSFSGSGQEYVNDLEFMYLYMYRDTPFSSPRRFYNAKVRDYSFFNETCNSADDIQNLTTLLAQPQGYFHNYLGATTVAGLQTSKTAIGTINANFTNKIHKGALWFKANVLERQSFILEVSKMKDMGNVDDIIRSAINPTRQVRISLFNKCSDSTAFYSEIFSLNSQGIQYRIERVSGGINIDDGTTVTFVALASVFPNESFFVAMDDPIYEVQGVATYEEAEDEQTNPLVTKYRTAPADGCYSIVTRDVLYSQATITWDKITFRKKSTYESTCTFNQPIAQGCKAVPYKYGKFSYWESRETYPDNQELFNSSTLKIKPEDLTDGFRVSFEQAYVEFEGGSPLLDVNGNYILKAITNFSCLPIRHYKFPDNKVSPFMYENRQASFSKTLIFPLGVTIDENLVNSALDLAVKNSLITQQRRDEIIEYEIVRGDIQQDRSIVASGLLFDMRKYKEQNQSETLINNDIYYSTYPYNDLGDDKLFFEDKTRTALLEHPFAGQSNNKYTFHSPETDYYRPTLPSEMSIQGYMFGRSKGNFNMVEDHSKWVILSDKARSLATTLAIIEATAEVVIQAAQAASNAQVWFVGGFTNGFSAGVPAFAAAATIAALGIVEGIVSNVGRYRYQWLETFRNLGQPQNFAYYYYSEGDYNYLKALQEPGNSLRALQSAKYMKEGMFTTTNEVQGDTNTINNLDRERAVYLDLGEGFNIQYDSEYKTYDNNKVSSNTSSLTFASENGACVAGKSPEIKRNVASPYVALKNYLPSQYGTLNSVKWMTTGYSGDLLNPKEGCLSVFGGDTFIGRHTLKRKIPLFSESAFGLAALTPFNYKFYSNIGKNPRFYVDYEVLTEFSRGKALFPEINYDLRFDCTTRKGNYFVPPSKLYLYYYGVPSFLTETRINTNNRTAEPTIPKDFYPNYGDLGTFTQEKNVSVREPNYFFYNQIYSKGVTPTSSRTLSDIFNQSEADCRNDKPNGIMWSLMDNSENNYEDPWLNFMPLDRFEFPTSYGKLKDIRTIENEQILTRFEHTTALFNTVDMTVDDGKTPETRNLQSAFARRPMIYSETDLGYGGTTSSQSVSCEFGHFHVDAPRGQVVQIENGGRGMQEISAFIDGKPSGLKNWFKNNLPFKILKYFPEIDTDNAYNGVGITMGWDSRFRRVFITKKDYIVRPLAENQELTLQDGNFILSTTVEDETTSIQVDFSYTDVFKEVSFTISYSPVTKSWVSWYSFFPNYYISHQNYFQTGINTEGDKYGLWSHLLTNRSYQVFYGEKHPFLIEYSPKREYGNTLLKSITWQGTTRRYHNEFDYAEIEDKPMNKLRIFSDYTHSGDLNLVFNTGQISLISKYPRTASNGNSQEVLVSRVGHNYKVNQFYNRVLKPNYNKPLWFWDDNQILRNTNTEIVKFGGKTVLETMKSNVFRILLQQDAESRLKYTIDLIASNQNVDN